MLAGSVHIASGPLKAAIAAYAGERGVTGFPNFMKRLEGPGYVTGHNELKLDGKGRHRIYQITKSGRAAVAKADKVLGPVPQPPGGVVTSEPERLPLPVRVFLDLSVLAFCAPPAFLVGRGLWWLYSSIAGR